MNDEIPRAAATSGAGPTECAEPTEPVGPDTGAEGERTRGTGRWPEVLRVARPMSMGNPAIGDDR
jgi:hypothetical protein